jgi:hypothetical protein
MIRKKSLAELEPWLENVRVGFVASFANGVVRDGAAVSAAITSPWSNGQREGQITKLKLVKRQMYGRGKIDLLQARVIGAGQASHHQKCVRALFSRRYIARALSRGAWPWRQRRQRGAPGGYLHVPPLSMAAAYESRPDAAGFYSRGSERGYGVAAVGSCRGGDLRGTGRARLGDAQPRRFAGPGHPTTR